MERGGFRCWLAADGPARLQLYATHSTTVVAVLIDMTMPGMTGMEVAKRLRQLSPQLPVLLMSGYTDVNLSNKADSLVYSGFVPEAISLGRFVGRRQKRHPQHNIHELAEVECMNYARREWSRVFWLRYFHVMPRLISERRPGKAVLLVIDEATGRHMHSGNYAPSINRRGSPTAKAMRRSMSRRTGDRRSIFTFAVMATNIPPDGFGFRGQAVEIVAGGQATLKPADQYRQHYRTTGVGIYADSIKLGKAARSNNPF